MAHTPHSPDTAHAARVERRPDYWVLSTEPATAAELSGHIRTAFAERIALAEPAPESADADPVRCTIDGTEQFQITISEASPEDKPRRHPVLGPETDLDGVHSVIVVRALSALPGSRPAADQDGDETEKQETRHRPAHDELREQIYVHAELAATLATLPHSIAVCRVPRGVHRPFAVAAPTFVNAVLNDIVSGYLVDIVVTDEDNPTGFTVGMADAGHPELQWRGSELAAAELYNALSDICQWALTRHPIADGNRLRVPGFPHPLRASEGSWLAGTRPALELTPISETPAYPST